MQSLLIAYQKDFGEIITLDRLYQLHANLFKNISFNKDDENFFYRITNPVIQETIINTICRHAAIFRDKYIVDCIKNLKQEGKNVFVVYGATHSVMQEKEIRNLWQ